MPQLGGHRTRQRSTRRQMIVGGAPQGNEPVWLVSYKTPNQAMHVAPLCYCPRYYIGLSVAGIIPLLCGPRLYRWFGGVYIFAALLFAVGEHPAALHQTEQSQRMRAEAQAQHP
jgi:hypothetical protein